MPRLQKPESAIDRLSLLKKSTETADKVQEGDKTYLTPATLQRIADFTPQFEAGMGRLGTFSSLKQKEIREKNSAMSELQTYMRDIWAGKRRHIYRENLHLEVFAYYQLPQSGNNPDLTQEGQWLETAQFMIEGEANAIKAGYPLMANPSMAEMEAKLVIARKERKEASEADKQFDKAQEAVSDLMPEAKKIIDRIIAELNFYLYEKDDASRRRIMRNYGVRYVYTINEQNEDEDDNVPEEQTNKKPPKQDRE